MVLALKNLLFTIVVPAAVAGYAPLLIAGDRRPVAGPLFALAVVVLGCGAITYGWCVWDFAVFGRGTPFPLDAPKKLVVRGLYRYTRNPMYLGVLTVIMGWAILYRSLPLVGYALFMGACFHAVVIGYEERHLTREFGKQYTDYCARVCRWVPTRRGSTQGY
jgi:protein-S-isoprenylcysteine O-methyltransferase Ste14